MVQQLIALIIILYFVIKLFVQKYKGQVGGSRFLFWLSFWVLSALVIIFIKYIDTLVARIGFSGRGIDVLFYLAVVLIFYFVFKLNLKIEKIERDITTIVREISYNKKQK